MRFFKVLNTIPSKWNKFCKLEKDDIILYSKYFKQLVICSDGKKKTLFKYKSGYDLLNEICDGNLTLLTEKELEKIKPHLRKEVFKNDL